MMKVKIGDFPSIFGVRVRILAGNEGLRLAGSIAFC